MAPVTGDRGRFLKVFKLREAPPTRAALQTRQHAGALSYSYHAPETVDFKPLSPSRRLNPATSAAGNPSSHTIVAPNAPPLSAAPTESCTQMR